jgi:hypothetical protein
MSSGDPSDNEEDAPAPQHDDGDDGIIVQLMQDVNIRKTTVPRGFSAIDGIMKIYACTRKAASNTWNYKLARYPELQNHLSFIKFKGAGSKLVSLHNSTVSCCQHETSDIFSGPSIDMGQHGTDNPTLAQANETPLS